MIAPTPGRFVVGINAGNGRELWRFKPEGRTAFRGLIYWPGGQSVAERVLFCARKYLYALDPKTGLFRSVDFGEQGRTLLPPADPRAASARRRRPGRRCSRTSS